MGNVPREMMLQVIFCLGFLFSPQFLAVLSASFSHINYSDLRNNKVLHNSA